MEVSGYKWEPRPNGVNKFPMYFGEVHTAVDEKGRIMVPQAFRTIMDDNEHQIWCLTRGFENYIFLFHRKAWDAFLLEHKSVFSGLDSRRSMMRRLFVGGMERVRRDGQGRVAIPQHLRDYAGIDREAVLIGVGEHLELWSKDGWRQYQERQSEQYRTLADELLAGPGLQAGAVAAPAI